MDVLRELEQARRACHDAGRRGRLGLVPTMGALHEGHLSLVRRARADCDTVAVTIFVNPLQFGAHEDLDRYPRQEAQDAELLRAAGADLVLLLQREQMYPKSFITRITQDALGETLEGAAREGHFDGVLTVVAKLFGIAGPCRAFFGHKDFQQSVVVRRMVADLELPAEVVVCPTVRDTDGLALSSRNAYLSPEERAQGLSLVAALGAANRAFLDGEHDSRALEALMLETLRAGLGHAPDYAALVDPDDFSRPAQARAGCVAVVAAPVGSTRLLDNHALGSPLGPFAHES
ncbi:MAG: pantothenate synthetase [Planctomycetota bacterium]|nr:MAG: pantothenate synthetase [Planctomycetota bacterium]